MKKQTDLRTLSQTSHNGETLRRAVSWAIDAKIFSNLTFHGNTSWKPLELVFQALIWVWTFRLSSREAFDEACAWSTNVFGRVALGTYQGLMKSLLATKTKLLPACIQRLQDVMNERFETNNRIGGWFPLAVDGSRVSTPRTKANEKSFCAPNYGQSARARTKARKRRAKGIRRRSRKKPQPVKPQIWLTLLWHMGLHMPWTWTSRPSNSNERTHFQELLQTQKFHENTLFCADAGFVSYALWRSIIDRGHSFLIRVGGNVKLLRESGRMKKKDGIVYLWPKKAEEANDPPLILRLLHVRVGRRMVWLVTNVLEEKKTQRCSGVGVLSVALGDRGAVSDFEADVWSGDASESYTRACQGGVGLVVVWRVVDSVVGDPRIG